MKILVGICILFCTIFLLMMYMGCTNVHIHKKSKPGQIKVACIGDSITYGCMVSGWPWRNYPYMLGKFLGDGYHVENFGVSARTLQDTGDHPYTREKTYQSSLSFLPQIVILKLGTNDSKSANWINVEVFVSAYRKLVAAYKALPSKPVIYLCTPAAAYAGSGATRNSYAFDIREENLSAIRYAVRQIALEDDLPVIDLAEATSGHREWFCADGIHPNALGAERMAEMICGIIENKKMEDPI